MPAEAPDPPRMTPEEFFAFAEEQEGSFEFRNGEVVAMSGGKGRHSDIGSRLSGMLYQRLRGTPCRHNTSDLFVAIPGRENYLLPDASITCGPRVHEDEREVAAANPKVIFEVLSASTQDYDRGRKFDLYRRIPSLEEYVVIAQGNPLVIGHLRESENAWHLAAWTGLDAVARVRSVPLELPLAELYAER